MYELLFVTSAATCNAQQSSPSISPGTGGGGGAWGEEGGGHRQPVAASTLSAAYRGRWQVRSPKQAAEERDDAERCAAVLANLVKLLLVACEVEPCMGAMVSHRGCWVQVGWVESQPLKLPPRKPRLCTRPGP